LDSFLAGFSILPKKLSKSFTMNRNNHPVEIDHIDPRWKEGRDYQLVCGLDCPLNYREEDWKKNTAKSNRFLPWRWIRDEVGGVPCEHGDWAYFLVGADIENDAPGKWVLMEFLSEEWFEATKSTGGGARIAETRIGYLHSSGTRDKIRLANTGKSHSIETREKLRLINTGLPKSEETLDKLRAKGKEVAMRPGVREAQSLGAKNQHSQRWQCTMTGHVSSPCGLTKYQMARGIGRENRVRLS
jgi:hypothetical protein